MKPEPSTLDAKPGVDDGAYLLDGVIRTVEGETSKLLRDQMKIYAGNRFMFAFFDDQTKSTLLTGGNSKSYGNFEILKFDRRTVGSASVCTRDRPGACWSDWGSAEILPDPMH